MPVNNPFALIAGIQYVDGTASTATSFTGTVAMSFNGTDIVGLRSDANDNLLVTGTLTHNSAAPIADNFGVLPAVASSAAPTYNAGDQVLLSTDLSGNLRVNATFSGLLSNNITEWASVVLGAPTVYGTAPTGNVVIGVNAFVTNTVATTVSGTVAVTQSTSPWVVSLASTTITGTVAVTQSTSPWVTAGNLTNNNAAPTANNVGVLPAIASTAVQAYTTGDQVLLNTTLTGALREDQYSWAGTVLGAPSNYGTSPGAVEVIGVNAFITNTIATTVSGTVAVTQSTSPWVVSLTSTTITGTVAVTQSTSPWVVGGNLTNNNAAPTTTNVGVLPAIASTAVQAYTTGDQVLLNTTLTGAIREDQYSLAGTALGAPSNYGTSPGAVSVQGVNAFVTNTVAVTLTSTTITGTVAVTQSTSPWVVNVSQVAGTTLGATAVTNFGTAPAAAAVPGVNASLFAGTTGLTAATFGTTATGTGLLTNASLFVGTTVAVAASAGVQKVGISGATGVTLDAAQNAAAPANELVIGGVYNTTVPTLTAGNATQMQVDSTGSQYNNNEGRKQTYRCGIISFGPLASSSPTISMTGSATKTIRILRIRLSVTAATGTVTDLSLKRFSTLTGGTSASQSANIAKLDTNNATATGVVNLYTAAATTITTAGVLAAERYEIVTAAVTLVPGSVEWDFSDKNGQACVLRGTGDAVGIVFSALGTTPDGDCWIEWTEE